MKKLLYTVVFLTILISCKDTVVTRDTRPPEFILKIMGDGLNEEITDDFDFDNKALYLRRGVSYRMIFTFTDRGGLKEQSWIYPNGIFSLGDKTSAVGIMGFGATDNPYITRWKWDAIYPMDPPEEIYRSNVITYRNFKAVGLPPTGEVDSYDWETIIIDMHDNETKRTLVTRITDEPSRIGSID